MREHFDEKKPILRESIEAIRLRYWYEGLKQRTSLHTAYELERHFEKESFQRNSNGTIRHYRSKWSRYEQSIHTPKSKTLKRVELLAPGSTREIDHPLWRILKLTDPGEIDAEMILRTLSFDVQEIIFVCSFSGLSSYSNRKPITQRVLDQLERRASLDCLTCLICLLLEASSQKRAVLSTKIALTVHNVILMMGIELYARKVALPLLDILIERILPLGVMPHLKMWMISSDYIHASAHLNLMVYQTKRGNKRVLSWPQRAKLMYRLIHGYMGLDVQYAMAPQFELNDKVGDIPEELINKFNKASSLRNWAWDSIVEGRSEPMPPAELFV